MFPLEEHTLQLYVCSVADKLKYSSIKVYLCGVQYESVVRGYKNRMVNMSRLYYVLRGIRKSHPSNVIRRKPITIQHLHHMIKFINNSQFRRRDKALWKCLILMAFFALLRVSEYVVPSNVAFDPCVHLTPADVVVDSSDNCVMLKIKASKTDPFRIGCKIRLVQIGGPLCPVNAIKKYLRIRGTKSGPFFVLASGNYVTRKFVAAFLELTLPNEVNINTHSFRIGGASAAASSGVPDSAIKILGRWSSDCYRRYLHLDNNCIKQWHQQMSSLNSLTKLWNY